MTAPIANEPVDKGNQYTRNLAGGNLAAGNLARDFVLALRQLRRECRLSEYLVLILALVLSVAAVTSVGFFANRVERAMAAQAATLLAADAVVSSPAPITPLVREQAGTRKLSTTDVTEFPSVVLTEEGETALVSVKAVGARYPLRGELKLSTELYAEERVSLGAPDSGTVWIEPRLAGALNVATGDTLLFGDSEVLISALIAFEPDRSADVFQMAPRLMMNASDLDASGLLGEGSRARYRLLVAGEETQVTAFGDWLNDAEDPGVRWQTVEQGRPEIQSALVNARRFLGLAAAVAVLLSSAAVALAARQIAERDMNTGSLMRTFGASSNRVVRLILIRLALLALLATVVGSVIGYLAQFGLSALLGQWFAAELPSPSLTPLIGGLICSVLALAGFCLPTVIRAVDTPVLRVLRRDLPGAKPSTLFALASALASLGVLLSWLTRDWKLGLLLLLGLLLVVAVLIAVSRFLIALSVRVNSSYLRRALESLRRRPGSVSLQISAFSVGLLAILILTIVRNDVLGAWQQQVPEDAPNFFLVNIQGDEVEAMQKFLQRRGITENTLYPMIRARLESINDVANDDLQLNNEQGRRFAARDFNLSYLDEPRADNEVVEGEWWPQGSEKTYFSVEEDFAKDLGIDINDVLNFRVADKQVSGVVTNFRKVEWESFAVNFFVVGTPAGLADKPLSFVSSIYVADGQGTFIRELVSEFGGVTVLEIGTLIDRLTGILDRAALAVQYVFLFTLFAGVLVLWAAVLASRQERFREAAILRTLGASRQYLASSTTREFALIGLLAGLIASSIAALIAWLLVEHVMQLSHEFNFALWLIGVLAGLICVLAAGKLATRSVLKQLPIAVLQSQV